MTVSIVASVIWAAVYGACRLTMWYSKRQIAKCEQQILVIECEEYLVMVGADT